MSKERQDCWFFSILQTFEIYHQAFALRVAKVYLQLIGQIFDDGKCYFNFWLEGVPELPSFWKFHAPPNRQCLRENIQQTKIVVPPNHPILIGISIINHPFWDIPIFGNTQTEFIAENCIHSIAVSMGCPSSIDLVANLAANGDLDRLVSSGSGKDVENQGWVLLHDMSMSCVYMYIYIHIWLCRYIYIYLCLWIYELVMIGYICQYVYNLLHIYYIYSIQVYGT